MSKNEKKTLKQSVKGKKQIRPEETDIDFLELDEFAGEDFEEIEEDFEETEEDFEETEEDFEETEEDFEEMEEEFPDESEEEYANTDEDMIYIDDEEETSEHISGDAERKARRKRIWMGVGVTAGVLIALYLGISAYFMGHFFVNTEVNGLDFSAKSLSAAEEVVKEQVKDYELTLLENHNKKDTIHASEIDLQYAGSEGIRNLLKEQNAFLWPGAFFKENKKEIDIDVSYDEDKLEQKINGLQCLKEEQIPSVSAYPKFDGTRFVVEPEVIGTAVDITMLHEKINLYISRFQSELNLKEEQCYTYPKYTSESPEVQAACDKMNTYLKASITYPMDVDVVIDKTVISSWLYADEDMNVIFLTDKVKEWLAAFGDRYDTYDKTRKLTTPWGKETEVGPGNMSWGGYGWAIDEETELQAILDNINNGETVTREPAYYHGQTAASHGEQDWGTTFAEVDLTEQHMWYVKDGQVVMESDVITGVGNSRLATPSGVYQILEKDLDSVLVGEIDPETNEPEYRTPVDFWIRVTWTGIGFHDANWQPDFGGDMYLNGYGSHGCINMPYEAAKQLYSLIEMGTPVVIHY